MVPNRVAIECLNLMYLRDKNDLSISDTYCSLLLSFHATCNSSLDIVSLINFISYFYVLLILILLSSATMQFFSLPQVISLAFTLLSILGQCAQLISDCRLCTPLLHQ